MPVDVKSDAQGSCGFVDTIPRKQHDRRSTRDGRGKMPVFSQQDPILFGAARGEGAVGKSARGKNGVVTSRTQPSAEAAQHLVAQKPRHLPHPEPAMMLVYITAIASTATLGQAAAAL